MPRPKPRDRARRGLRARARLSTNWLATKTRAA